MGYEFVGLVNSDIHWITPEDSIALRNSPEFVTVDKYPVNFEIHDGEVGCLISIIRGTNLLFVLGRFGVL